MASIMITHAPKEFLCPITQDLMEDPVFAEDGFTYEKVAIERWFSTGRTRSPVTNELISGQNLITNKVLKVMITSHKEKLGAELLRATKHSQLTAKNVLEFIDSGADLNVRDEDGNTPLLLLAAAADADLVEALISHGAKVSIRNDMGDTAIDLCARHAAVSNPARWQAILNLMNQRSDQEAREQEAAERARVESLHASRQQQRDLRNQQREANGVGNQGFGPNISVGTGFFPSLYGLQFQRGIPSPIHRPPTGMTATEMAKARTVDRTLKILSVALLVYFFFFLG